MVFYLRSSSPLGRFTHSCVNVGPVNWLLPMLKSRLCRVRRRLVSLGGKIMYTASPLRRGRGLGRSAWSPTIVRMIKTHYRICQKDGGGVRERGHSPWPAGLPCSGSENSRPPYTEYGGADTVRGRIVTIPDFRSRSSLLSAIKRSGQFFR